MNIFIIFVSITLLLLSLLSNYVYVWLFGIQRIHTVTAAVSVVYVAITIAVSGLGRSTYALAPIAARLSGLLLGIGYYLLICSVVGIVVYALLVSINRTPSGPTYASILLVLAAILTIAAFAYAQTITTRNHTLTLSENPTQTKTIALIADTHFGPARNTRLADRFVSKITELSPDMILYAGDMYDGPAFDFATINPALSKLSTIAPVYFAPGNHEGYGPYDEFISNNESLGFQNLIDSAITDSGLTILGLSYRLPEQSEQLQSYLQSLKSNKPELFDQPIIAIHHSPILLDVLSKNGVDVTVHGHTHRGQFWPNALITRMIYGIYHYGRNQYDDMEVITTSGVGTAGPAMRLFNTPEIVVLTVQY